MGYLRHQALLIHGWREADVLAAHTKAAGEFNAVRHGSLVSGLIKCTVNSGASFFVAPDGSKEGWEDSSVCDEARRRVVEYLKTTALDWMHVIIGGDDVEYRVEDCPHG